MKGFGPITFPFILIMFSICLVLLILIRGSINQHFIQTVQYEHNYNNAHQTLITLLSSTHNGKTVSEIISEHMVFGDDVDISFLNQKLEKIVPSKCFKLSTHTEELAKSSGCDASKFSASTKLVLPYQEYLTGELMLVID